MRVSLILLKPGVAIQVLLKLELYNYHTEIEEKLNDSKSFGCRPTYNLVDIVEKFRKISSKFQQKGSP